MLLLHAALLGMVQGLTEFLPVSSSAHLILARAFFGWDAEQFGRPFDVACHIGTLAAILVYFRHDLVAMVMALPRAIPPVTDRTARLLWLIIVGTIPLVPIGLALADLEDTLRTPKVIVVTLAVVGVARRIDESLGGRLPEEGLAGPRLYRFGDDEVPGGVPVRVVFVPAVVFKVVAAQPQDRHFEGAIPELAGFQRVTRDIGELLNGSS